MRRLIHEESGATAILVAILMVVLVGITAFVVDIGDVNWERRMLQNSADAAALAVAIDCAQGDCAGYEATANSYANANNRRGAFVESVTGPGGVAPTFAGREVTVVTRTGDSASPGTLRQYFSAILGQDEGLSTGASATAEWQTVGGAATLPLTISICEWWQDTTGGTSLPSGETYLAFKNADPPGQQGAGSGGAGNGNGNQGQGNAGGSQGGGAGGSLCELDVADYPGDLDPNEWPGGLDFPGGFGWLDLSTDPRDAGKCISRVELGEVGGSVGNPGFPTGGRNDGNSVCNFDYYNSLLNQTVLLPVHIDYEGEGQGATYEITGFAGFKITGFKLGSGQNLVAPSGFNCPFGSGNNAVCIRGTFESFVASDATPSSDAIDLGALTVRLIR